MTDQEKAEMKEAIENIKDPMDKFNARRMFKLAFKEDASELGRQWALKDVKKLIAANPPKGN